MMSLIKLAKSKYVLHIAGTSTWRTLSPNCTSIDSFIQYTSNIKPHVKFTSEQKEDGKLPFLYTCVHVKADRNIKTTVYKKPTQTDQYLKFKFNQHLLNKIGGEDPLTPPSRTSCLMRWRVERKRYSRSGEHHGP